MIALAFLLSTGLQAGAAAPTVGDTIWISRIIRVAPQQTVRPVEWEPADPVELAGAPRLTVQGSTATIAYPLIAWRAGAHRVEIPGPLLLGADGSTDSLPPYVATLRLASVLPTVPPDSSIAPQPRASFVPRRATSLLPLLVLWLVAALLVLPLRWWWWRRGVPTGEPLAREYPLDVPVDRWIDAGEYRAVASLVATRLRAATARSVTGLSAVLDAEVGEVLAALDRARFGTAADEDAPALFRRAAQLEDRLNHPTA